VDDRFLVEVFEALSNLLHDLNGLLLGQLPLLLDLLERAIRQQLHDEVEMVLVVKVAVERSAVAVVEIALQLYLPCDVLLHLQLSDLFLRHLLYHANEAELLLLRNEDLAEGTLAQLIHQLEVIYCNLP
jgi:hypothetical protein